MNKNLLFTVVSLLMVVTSFSQDVTTFAGSGSTGDTDATGTAASFYVPSDVAVDAAGNVYVADAFNNKIRKITPAGVVTTFAGSGTQGSADGTGATASFKSPRGVAVDASGNVYVADQENDKIRKITASGVVTTFAGSSTYGSTDGIGTAASFDYPYGLTVDGSGNVYVADTYNHKIRKITPAGVVSTFAGSGTSGSVDGTGTAASFSSPHAVVVDVSGNVYVADTNNNRIRKITAAGVVTTLAGSGDLGSADGIGTAASFSNPRGLTVDGSGNVYVGDSFSHKIRKITATGVVTTFAGSGSSGSLDGTGTAASLALPYGVDLDGSGNLYVADSGNSKIRKITPPPATHLNFDGVNDRINCGNSPSVQITGSNITLEAMIRLNSFASFPNDGNIINKEQNSPDNGYMLRVGGSGIVNFNIGNGSWNEINSPVNAVQLATWHHVVGTYDGVTMKIYVDGVMVTSQPSTMSIGNSTSDLFIGDWPNGGRNLDGDIDEVRIWNVARTAEQINGSKNCELQGTETGLVAYYKFNQGIDAADNTAITSLIDATANVNNGTLVNFTKTGSTSNFLSGSPVTTGSIIPSVATVTTPVTYNQGATATALTATTGTNGSGLLWYTAATSGTGATTAPTPSSATVGSTSYWVSSTNANGCESERTEIVVNVIAPATHLNFDGTNDYVTAGNILSSSYTKEAMIFLVANSGSNNIISGSNSAGQHAFWVPNMILSAGHNGNWGSVQDAVNLALNTWYHVAVSYDSATQTLRLYKNGVLISTATNIPAPINGNQVLIGSYDNGNLFNGNIDEVRIWNKVLTATDIMNHMNCELQSAETGLVAYYKFNQGFNGTDNTSITTIADASGNANNGTLTNFARTGTTSNFLSGSPIVTGTTCTTLNASSFDVASNINIYPNPTNGNVNIMVNNLTNVSVSVYDLNGRQILNKEVSNNTNTIDISNLQTGMYLFRIKSSEGEVVKKVIKN